MSAVGRSFRQLRRRPGPPTASTCSPSAPIAACGTCGGDEILGVIRQGPRLVACQAGAAPHISCRPAKFGRRYHRRPSSGAVDGRVRRADAYPLRVESNADPRESVRGIGRVVSPGFTWQSRVWVSHYERSSGKEESSELPGRMHCRSILSNTPPRVLSSLSDSRKRKAARW